MSVKTKRNFFDAIDFDEIGDSLDLFIHNIQTAFDYDALDGKDTFNAIVLSPPVPLTATKAEMSSFFAAIKKDFSNVDTLPKFTFRARLIESDSAHVFWPDVCDPKFIENGGSQEEALDWISKHMKVIAINATQLPRVGDIVTVKLTNQGIFTASPEQAIMQNLVTSLDSPSDTALQTILSQECKLSIESLFKNYDGSTLADDDFNPMGAIYKDEDGVETPVENGRLEEANVDLFVPGANHEGDARFIAEAIESFNKLAEEYEKEFGEPISIRESYRDYDTQLEYRKLYKTGAARVGSSNHGWGVAFDVNRTLIVGTETLDPDDPDTRDKRFDSEVYIWLHNGGKGRYGWKNPKSLQRGTRNAEAWHWENLAVRNKHMLNIKELPEGTAPDGAEKAPEE